MVRLEKVVVRLKTSKDICLCSKNDPQVQHSVQLGNVYYFVHYLALIPLQSSGLCQHHIDISTRKGLAWTQFVVWVCFVELQSQRKKKAERKGAAMNLIMQLKARLRVGWVLGFLNKCVYLSLIWTIAGRMSLFLLLLWSRTLWIVFVHRKVSRQKMFILCGTFVLEQKKARKSTALG